MCVCACVCVCECVCVCVCVWVCMWVGGCNTFIGRLSLLHNKT